MTLDGHLKTGLMFALVICTCPDAWVPAEFKTYLAIAVFIGNIAPDFLEFGVIPHRTFTHYPVLWLGILSLSGLTISQQLPLTFFDVSAWWIAAGFSVGCLWHILCDWPYYGGVPLLYPRRKVALFGWEFEGVMNRVFEHSMLVAGLAIMFSSDIAALLDTSTVSFP